MASNDWLMKRDALHAARKCSRLIEQRLGLKLSLAHPAFLSMLGDYACLYDCDDIQAAYFQLVDLAPANQARDMRARVLAEKTLLRPVISARTSIRIRPEQVEA